ncbi:hypothetical protein KPNIH19_07827 [Klebsiella pneumoniae subsp. pneumoniae KPNIH19]|nr:hypothetical protein KPNIH11_00015 [Klebsiella pneumoniae subsp. pneumoniae KPNIH11]EJK25859.1 hypothetical protein KPNIH19_07827 [Klebsiella pneumoniae subsp. pneumoniae KPNIH19]
MEIKPNLNIYLNPAFVENTSLLIIFIRIAVIIIAIAIVATCFFYYAIEYTPFYWDTALFEAFNTDVNFFSRIKFKA